MHCTFFSRTMWSFSMAVYEFWAIWSLVFEPYKFPWLHLVMCLLFVIISTRWCVKAQGVDLYWLEDSSSVCMCVFTCACVCTCIIWVLHVLNLQLYWLSTFLPLNVYTVVCVCTCTCVYFSPTQYVYTVVCVCTCTCVCMGSIFRNMAKPCYVCTCLISVLLHT